jgi:hypothetical protein
MRRRWRLVAGSQYLCQFFQSTGSWIYGTHVGNTLAVTAVFDPTVFVYPHNEFLKIFSQETSNAESDIILVEA